jgi:KipI family sensor histidine kinase inhibitor
LLDGPPIWKQVSDCALLARLNGPTPVEVQAGVTSLFGAIREANIEGIRNLHPAFRSLLVIYDPLLWTPHALLHRLEEAGSRTAPIAQSTNLVNVPVCFAVQFSLDLPEVCAIAGLDTNEAVRLFTCSSYRVAFIGFAPGFPYLLGLPPGLAVPRHARPRTHIPAGSVGIAGEQTGIYPADTPGGWQIIGRTPLRLFDQGREPMSLLRTGDAVCFVVIDESRYEELSQW